MKKIIIVGAVGSGKTTLLQRLHGLKAEYKKTQALEIINESIDTPGEFLEHRRMLRNLINTSVDVERVLFVADPTQDRFMYSPGLASAFNIPVAGVVTKTDLADEKQIADTKELLEMTGADPVFAVSAVSGEGLDELKAYLS